MLARRVDGRVPPCSGVLIVWTTVRFIVGDPLASREARLRYQLYSVFVALAMPTMVGFGTLALGRRDFLLSGLILASAIGLVAGWLRLRFGRDDRWVYRVNVLVFAVLALNLLATGGEGGSKSLWLYCFPLIVAFLLGEREGAAWGAGFLLAACAVLWLPQPFSVYPYEVGYKLRFVVMYLVITIVSLGFEYSRRVFQDAMLVEQQLLRREIAEREKAEREKAAVIQELQETLAQVKTLKGLVPICANCHRIRDDRGFWNQLETYLREHSDAKFSHGICPGCMAALYPDFKPE